jgi:hypothetical protein
VLGGLPLHDLLAVAGGLLAQPDVLDDVLRRLDDDEAAVVESLAPGAPGDLVELTGTQVERLLAIELAQASEQDRSDGHVDARAEGVRPADHLEQSRLRELLDEHAVLREQTRVMEADAVPEPLADVGAVRAAEREAGDARRDLGLLLPGADLEAGEVLRAARGVLLCEVDDIGGRLALVHEFLDRMRQRNLGVGVLEGHGTIAGFHRDRRAPVEARDGILEESRVAERRRHQEESRLRHREQRHLPRDATVAVRVVMELVHHHVVDGRVRAFAQRDVGEDLGGAAENRCAAVHGRVTGREAHPVRAELAAQPHPLLVDERLDRTRVHRPLPARERGKQHRRRDERLAGSGRRVQDDVPAVEQLEDRFFLGRVERQAHAGAVLEEAVEQHVAGGVPRDVGEEVGEGDGHPRPVVQRNGRARGISAADHGRRGRLRLPDSSRRRRRCANAFVC